MKNLLQFTFEKNNLLCKKWEKKNLLQGKILASPGYQMVRPLVAFSIHIAFHYTLNHYLATRISKLNQYARFLND